MVTVARSPTPVLPSVSMSQSGLMVAALIGGFVVWLALSGKLATYWSILIGGGASSTASTSAAPATPSSTSSSTSTASNVATLPSSQASVLGLGGTGTAAAPATGGVGTATPTGVPGVPNVSLQNFFGLDLGSG